MAKPWENYQKSPEITSEGPWSKYQSDTSPKPGEPRRTEAMAMGAFTGMANILGAPTDVINLGLEQVGLGTEKPFGGSEYLKKQLQSIQHGYTDISQIPERHRPYAVAGETFGENLPFIAAPYALPQKTGSAIINAITQTARNMPKKYLTVEMIYSLLSGAGAGVAEQVAPGDPLIRLGGEVVGPLAPGSLVLRSSGLVGHQIRNIKAKISKSGREEAASVALQEELKAFDDDINKAIKNLQSDSPIAGENLFAGEKSGSPVLLALQQKYLKENPRLSDKHREAIVTTLREYRKAAKQAIEAGDKDALRQLGFWQQQLLLDTLAQDVALATQRAEQAARRVRPTQDKGVISAGTRQILEDAYTTGRQGERAVWGAVPNDIEVTSADQLNPIVEAYNRIIDEENIIDVGEVPSYLSRMIDRIGELSMTGQLDASITTGELKQLRSQLLRFARTTRDSPKSISFAMNEMADSVLDSFDNLGLGDIVDDARAYSRQFNNLFTRGKVGDLLGYTRKGGVKVEPELTLQRTLGPGGTGAAVAGKQVERAAQLQRLPPQGRGQPLTGQATSRSSLQRRTTRVEQEDFIKQLADAARDPATDRVNPKRLENFVKGNSELLKRFPRLRQELSSAASAEKFLQRVEKAQIDKARKFEAKSVFNRLMNSENSSLVIGDVLKSRNPIEGYKELVDAAKAHSQVAVDGLRTATFDWVFQNSMRGDMLSAEDVGRILTSKPSPKSEDLIGLMVKNNILTKKQALNLQTVLERMGHIEDSLTKRGAIALKIDDPNMLEDLLARLIGSNLAGSSMIAQNTGSSLLMAHAGSRWAREIMNKLPIESIHKIIEEAIMDTSGQKMADLLSRDISTTGKRRVEQQMEAWLWGAGTRYITERENKPQAPRPGFLER